jgi:hypothetical protein
MSLDYSSVDKVNRPLNNVQLKGNNQLYILDIHRIHSN